MPLRAARLQDGRRKQLSAGSHPQRTRVALRVLCPSILGLHVAESHAGLCGCAVLQRQGNATLPPPGVCPATWGGLVVAAAAGVKLEWGTCKGQVRVRCPLHPYRTLSSHKRGLPHSPHHG